jgi:hypothetical protein
LPVAARATPDLTAIVRTQSGYSEFSPRCRVMAEYYSGDEGIMCRLAFDGHVGHGPFIVSITHLNFDRRHGLARGEIASYQKHRIKRLRRG